MEYKIIKPINLDFYKNKYHCSSLLAKTLEFLKYDDETFQSITNQRLIFHDFDLFEESDFTLSRIEEAIIGNEKICVYGDYDCDGILATTILVQAFLQRGIHVGYHIPHRFIDGYGLNVQRVEQIAQKGYSLIITVDNGVKAFDAIERANELGIDVIVTDHHQFDIDLPDAYSFVHTKLSPHYPFKEISGGLVAYKLASALLGKHDKYLFSLAAITLISDMMPLLDENRAIVKRALQFMNEEHFSAIDLLANNEKISATTIGYTIAPKINSFGRLPELCNPVVLVKYFLKDCPQDLRIQIAQKAIALNQQRQKMTKEQYQLIQNPEQLDYLFIASSDFHEGLIGLIASQYTREYEKPSFVMYYDKENNLYRGSARSVDGFSLHRFFSENSDLFIVSGGHALAGGFSIDGDHFDLFKERLNDAINKIHFTSCSDVLQIELSDLSVGALNELKVLEPFGMCYEEPLYCLKVTNDFRAYTMGNNQHLKIDLMSLQGKVSAIYFYQANRLDEINKAHSITLIGTIKINEFLNKQSVNMMVKDILCN